MNIKQTKWRPMLPLGTWIRKELWVLKIVHQRIKNRMVCLADSSTARRIRLATGLEHIPAVFAKANRRTSKNSFKYDGFYATHPGIYMDV